MTIPRYHLLINVQSCEQSSMNDDKEWTFEAFSFWGDWVDVVADEAIRTLSCENRYACTPPWGMLVDPYYQTATDRSCDCSVKYKSGEVAYTKEYKFKWKWEVKDEDI